MTLSEPLAKPSLRHLLELLAAANSRLVVFDSFNATLNVQGLDPSSTLDVERFWRLAAPLSAEAGAAVALLDHVVKNREDRGRYAYGSERKQTGAEVHLGLTVVDHFGRGRTGRARLAVHKDRAGFHRANPPGIFTLASTAGRVTWDLAPDETIGADGSFRPTGLMEKVSRHLELFAGEPLSQKQIEENVQGKATFVRAAVDALVREGFASEHGRAAKLPPRPPRTSLPRARRGQSVSSKRARPDLVPTSSPTSSRPRPRSVFKPRLSTRPSDEPADRS